MKSAIFTLVLIFIIQFNLMAQNIHWGTVIDCRFNDYVYDLQVDKDSNLVICGQFTGTVDFDPGPGVANLTAAGTSGSDIFLAKYDSQGNYLWAHSFGTGFLTDQGDRVAIDTSGNIFLTGMFGSTVDFDPDTGNTATISSPPTNRARFLAKYDSDGNFISVKQVGNAVGTLPSSQDGQTGLGCDEDGNVYMSGFYGSSLTLGPGVTLPVSGLSDNYFSKFDPQLNLIWAHRLGSNGTEYSQGMYVHPTGRIIVLGSFRNTIDFDPGPGTFNLTQTSSTQDGYFASYDSAGMFIFARQLEAGTSASPIATLIDNDQNIIVTGSCAGTMDADPGAGVSTVGAGFNDQAFVAAYDSMGNYRWAHAYGDIGAFNAIRYVGVDTANNIYVAGNYNPMVDINPGPDTAVFGYKYGTYVASYDTGGTFRNGFLLQEAKMRLYGSDIFLTGGFYGLVDFDPGPQNYPLQSDTLNASWYLLRMHLCDDFAASPGSITVPPLCAGDTVTFSVSQGGPQYEWMFPQYFTPIGSVNASSIIIAVNSLAISGTVFVQSIGGCQNSPLVYADMLVSQPTIPVITQANDSLFTLSTAVGYQWYLGGTVIPGANDSVYVPAVSGSYTVLITDSNGCISISDPFNFILSGFTDQDFNSLTLFPNPFNDELMIEFSNVTGIMEVTVVDMIGRSRKFNSHSNDIKMVIATGEWTTGLYTIIINNESGTRHFRVVKM